MGKFVSTFVPKMAQDATAHDPSSGQFTSGSGGGGLAAKHMEAAKEHLKQEAGADRRKKEFTPGGTKVLRSTGEPVMQSHYNLHNKARNEHQIASVLHTRADRSGPGEQGDKLRKQANAASAQAHIMTEHANNPSKHLGNHASGKTKTLPKKLTSIMRSMYS